MTQVSNEDSSLAMKTELFTEEDTLLLLLLLKKIGNARPGEGD